MLDGRDRVCVPIEVEIIPLYRESAWSARLRREKNRERRRQRRRSWALRRRVLVERVVSAVRHRP